jgi:truncated hemoglobin YjbI
MTNASGDRSLYEICGPEYFVSLVDAFYDGVETDAILMAM